MTPEQKEAFRREVLEEAAKVADKYEARWSKLAGFVGQSAGALIIGSALRSLAASQPAPAADTGQAVEDLAQWLHDEVEWPEYIFPNHTWPLHDKDTGRRDDAFVRLVPMDVVHEFRDIAKRLLSRHPAPLDASADTGKALGYFTADDIAEILFVQRQTGWCWEDAIDADTESDKGTLVSIVRDDAIAILKEFAEAHPAPLDAERVREDERLRFEGDLDKWMKMLGTGITGYQPEAYAVMDDACRELVKLRAFSLDAERVRELEDALKSIAELKPYRERNDSYNRGWEDGRYQAQSIANAALRQKEGGQ